ncbi:MAG: penicillin-binding protein 1B, partial [Gammaproteobacteria bacterium]|nr:penicillin-binding protein 1B [Gammaproteobacteria bacterium]
MPPRRNADRYREESPRAPAPRSWLRRVFWFCTVVGLALIAPALGYLWYLDRTMTDVFEGRRWSLPAQVYAAPVELYAGSPLTQRDFLAELERSGYTRASRPRHPGSFTENDDTVSVFLREFRFDDHLRASERIEVQFRDHGIIDITTGSGHAVPLVQLDPPLIGSFFPSHGEDRVVLKPEDVPPLLKEGLKAVEDKTFDSHIGFDLPGIIRAFWVNVTAGEVRQGGSTLTQQLVKSYFLDNSRTIKRKLHEVAMAIVLEARFSKEDLLNAYANEIFLGQS